MKKISTSSITTNNENNMTGGTIMKTTKRLTMKTIAATLAALSMMSAVSMVRAAEMTDIPAESAAEITAEYTDTAADTAAVETAEDIPAEETAETAPEEAAASSEESTYEDTGADTTADTSETDTSETDSAAVTYTITFDTDGGSDIAPITAEAGEAVIFPEEPVKDGFIFAGWDIDIPEFMPEEDMIITALWEEKAEHTITFDTDGGTETAPITAEEGTAIEAPADPTKDGFYFICWDIEIPEAMPEEDMTIKALWSSTPVYNSAEEGFADRDNVNGTDDDGSEMVYDDTEDDPILTSPCVYGPYTIDEYCLYAANSQDEDLNKVMDLGKDMGIAMADAGFEMLADAIPGGKILLAPFQVLFHKGVDDPDPMEIMNEKLDKISNKIDGLDKKMGELSRKSDENTAWIGRKVDNATAMSELRQAFVQLAPRVSDLDIKIRGAETNKYYVNNIEKVFMIASLSTKQEYKDVSDSVMIIRKHMYSDNSAFVSFYDTIYDAKALDCMISKEAYLGSKPIIDDLVTEYVCAVALMQEIEVARKAVANFTEDDIAQLSPDIRAAYEFYKKYDENTEMLRNGAPEAALKDCANGYKNYGKKYNNSDFINKGTCRKPLSFRRKYCEFSVDGQYDDKLTYKAWSQRYRTDVINKNGKITQEELKMLVDYIAATYPGTSIFNFFKQMGIKVSGVDYNDPYAIENDNYIVLNDSLTETIKETESGDIDSFRSYKTFNHRYGFISAVNCKDPESITKKDPLTIASYTQYKRYGWFGQQELSRYYDFDSRLYYIWTVN